MSGLSEGSYYIQASMSSQGYMGEVYPDVPCPYLYCDVTAGIPVAVTAGSTTGPINLALARTAGAITGFVSDATSGAAVASGVVVRAYDSGGRQAAAASVAYGIYTLRGLPAGSYHVLTTNTAGYRNEAYPDAACPGECAPVAGTPVTVVASQTTTGIDLALSLGAVVTGFVRDGLTAAPVVGVTVVLHDAGGATVGSATTGTSGDYSIPGLTQGTYLVRTAGAAGRVNQLYAGIACPSGSCTVTAGTPVVVGAPGSKTPGIDFALQAAAISFTDVPLRPGRSPVRAVHVTELRQAIDTLRSRHGLGTFAWTDPVLAPGGTPVKRVHLVELRAALDAAYAAAGRAAPSYTTPVVVGGVSPIVAAHIEELRAAVVALW